MDVTDRIDRDRELLPTTNINTQPVRSQPGHPTPGLTNNPISTNNTPVNNDPQNNEPQTPATFHHDSAGRYQASGSIEKLEDDTLLVSGLHREAGYSRDNHARLPNDFQRPVKARTMDTHISARRRSGIDWIVPLEEKSVSTPRRSVSERLQPSLDTAHTERDKYAAKAKMTGYALNAAIGLQVLLGSLTTGLSVVTTGKQTSIMTAILGGFATITASYLARARGSNEPELSITRVKDLEQFIRECQAFQMDYGHVTTAEHDDRLNGFRSRFEELLGNANGERKLSPPV